MYSTTRPCSDFYSFNSLRERENEGERKRETETQAEKDYSVLDREGCPRVVT